VLVGGLAILDAERANPEANITTSADAWWWAATTVTTVGYGDRYPTTGIGRLVAVALMICGIALLGAVTATLASWLVERIKVEETETRSDVAELVEEVRQLRAEVHRLTVPPSSRVNRASSLVVAEGCHVHGEETAHPRRNAPLASDDL
jgi:voltage-gated potassium channel